MSDLAAGLLLLSNMKTLATRSDPCNPSTCAKPPLVGRLHEMAVTRPSPPPDRLGLRPQWVIFGRPGRGKGALVKRHVMAEAIRSWPTVAVDPSRECVVFDELAGCEPLRLSGSVRALDPFTITAGSGAVWSPPTDGTAGEW
ncbi:hypothetical protein JCM18899A_47480 [Nocardioides sp. AN3]|jgi:hypothetical protein